MLYGSKHMVFLEVPTGWVQVHHPQLPFLIKPDKKRVSDDTYMYVYGIDYPEHPDLEEWIAGNNAHVQAQFPDLVIDSLAQRFANIATEEEPNRRYRTITYTYPNQKHEAILVVEGTYTVVVCVLSASGKKEFEQLLPGFLALAGSLSISNAEVKIED
jgi:hypothetical protein